VSLLVTSCRHLLPGRGRGRGREKRRRFGLGERKNFVG
jgi:hypothetical protein